jgi:hypothetical protein
MTFIAAFRCDRISAPWVIEAPINGELFTLCRAGVDANPGKGRDRYPRQPPQVTGQACTQRQTPLMKIAFVSNPAAGLPGDLPPKAKS